MASIKGKSIDVPPVHENQPPNPLLAENKCCPSPPSTTESPRTSQETDQDILERLLLYDQCCLVTGDFSTQLEVYRLVNTICVSDSNRERKEALKERVEYILTRQRFGSGKFSLDSLSNCVALGAQWHVDLDAHGSFCIAIPLQQIIEIVETLKASNCDWEDRVESDPQALRALDMTKDPFVVRECVLLVLRLDPSPHHNQSFSINTRRVLKDPDGSSLAGSGSPLWTSYSPQTRHPYLIDSSGQEFTEFDYVSMRDQDQELSIFSLLVHAHSKLQDAKRRADYLPGVKTYISFVKEAIAAIFFVPEGLQEKIPLELQEKASLPVLTSPSHLPKQIPTSLDPSTQSREGRDDSDRQDPSGVGRKDGDSEPDTINGLTFSQMETVLQKVSDGTISGQERVEAAMLMLGMAGHEYSQVFDPSGVRREDSSGIKEECYDWEIEFGDFDYYPEEDESEDDEPGMINGLTFPQMETVLQKVSDGTISGQERARAAMFMLGMAGRRSRG